MSITRDSIATTRSELRPVRANRICGGNRCSRPDMSSFFCGKTGNCARTKLAHFEAHFKFTVTVRFFRFVFVFLWARTLFYANFCPVVVEKGSRVQITNLRRYVANCRANVSEFGQILLFISQTPAGLTFSRLREVTLSQTNFVALHREQCLIILLYFRRRFFSYVRKLFFFFLQHKFSTF